VLTKYDRKQLNVSQTDCELSVTKDEIHRGGTEACVVIVRLLTEPGPNVVSLTVVAVTV
jgi:hypothetical protein